MSRRSLNNDDKLISEMILANIANASKMNIDMTSIFSIDQMTLLTNYKEIYNYDPYLSIFLSLALMSHCSQGSYYTHYLNKDQQPIHLYLWLLGPSGRLNLHETRF